MKKAISFELMRLIKERRTIRNYTFQSVPKNKIKKIIEAGRWAPSAHNLQPWYFVVVQRKEWKKKIMTEFMNASNTFLTSAKILSTKTFNLIEKAPTIVLVYNVSSFSKRSRRLGDQYFSVAYLSEIESVSAAIQNMLLCAKSIGLGAAWLTLPLLAKKEIYKVIKIKGELLAVLTLGYPTEKGNKLPRKSIRETIKYL